MSCPPPPSAADPIAELRLAALPSAVSNARRFARHQLRVWGLDELVPDVAILVSELVTNSTEATGTTTSPTSYTQLYDQRLATVLLRLRITNGDLYIEVWDTSTAPPVRGAADALDEHGRGLQLVAALSEEWNWYPSRIGGKITWCRVRATAPPVDTKQSCEPVADWPGPDMFREILAAPNSNQVLRRDGDSAEAST
jgi:anti-sigma regulatory factor (Ser/Thr protein kinase)